MKFFERPLLVDNSLEMRKIIQTLNIRLESKYSGLCASLLVVITLFTALHGNAQSLDYTLTKNITGVAESATPGLMDVSYEVTLTNVNIAPAVTDLQITDDVAANFGMAFIGLAAGPSIVSSTALIDPVVNGAYTASATDPNLLNGMSGLLPDGESVTIGYVVTVDPDLALDDLMNTATASAAITSGGATITPQPTSTAVLQNCWTDCVIACNNRVNIAVNTMCEVNILADMILEGEDEECVALGFYEVEIFDQNDNPIALPLDARYIGEQLKVVVTNVACGNSCWGDLLVEDKTPPSLSCDSDTVRCSEDISPYNPLIGFPVDVNNISPTADPQVFIASSVDACGEVELSYADSLVNLGCSDTLFSSVLYRKWTATDASGLMVMCTDTIYFTRGTIQDIVLPPHYDGINGNEDALTCDGDFCQLPNGFPAPEDCGTGSPQGVFCGNIQYDFWDDTIKVCASSYKLYRTWLIIDWCDPDNRVEYVQRIKVTDEEAPQVLSAPTEPKVLGMDDYFCGRRSYILPEPVYDTTGANSVSHPYVPTIIDECGTWTYTVEHVSVDPEAKDSSECAVIDDSQTFSTKNVRKRRDGRFELVNIPVGCNWIKYIIADDCGNTSEFSYVLFIEDNVAPVAVCHEHTVVSLTSDGTARVSAETFDDGSHDNCGLGDFQVRRMFEGNCPDSMVSDTKFRDYVEFCCNDIADNPIMVVMRVYDECGNNFSDCMVEVTVQDKLPPIITFCPGPETITCEDDYLPLDQFGDAEAYDNCNVLITTDSILDLNSCGTGTITRYFIATDDGGRQASCSQVITVVDDDPFTIDDITWPTDKILDNGCMGDTDPDETGRPTFTNADDDCTQVATSYEDLVFSQVDGACRKIIRKWRVVDWCQFEKNAPNECYPANAGRWCHTQVIKVFDNEGPEFTSECIDRSVCIEDADCEGLVSQEATAFDQCTPSDQLIWHYMIDLDNDGTYDVTGNRNSFSRMMEAGTYKVKFTVEDRCGNTNECEYELEVEDCKKPTPYCKNGVTTVVMPSTGDITIWASDFDAGSFDNCTDTTDLRFSFSSDINETNRVFTCDDIGNGISDTIEVTIYVWDEAGNEDFCKTVLILQDNQDVCPDSTTLNGMIAGLVTKETSDRMRDIEVALESSAMTGSKIFMTDDEGHFEFPDLEMYQDYYVTAKYDKDHMNGISTLDLVLIQRYLLGYEDFDSPYKYIAADVNNSSSISAGDISELRKLILGVYAELPKNESWRFVEKDQQFNDPKDPFPFNESISFKSFQKDEMASDFVAVKIGDVSGNAAATGLDKNTGRNGQMLMTVERPHLEGEYVAVPLTLAGLTTDNCIALQFTADYDSELLDFVELRSDLFEVMDHNVAVLEDGLITFSWGDVEPFYLFEGDVILTAIFEKRSSQDLIDPLVISSAVTRAVAYDSGLGEYDIIGKNADASPKFVLHQNTPNPFRGTTTIAFELPQEVDFSVEIFDMSGKVLKRVEGHGQVGYQSIDLDLSQFSESSVLYYQLNTEKYSATRKMVIIE